jgi:hypothetical protein
MVLKNKKLSLVLMVSVSFVANQAYARCEILAGSLDDNEVSAGNGQHAYGWLENNQVLADKVSELEKQLAAKEETNGQLESRVARLKRKRNMQNHIALQALNELHALKVCVETFSEATPIGEVAHTCGSHIDNAQNFLMSGAVRPSQLAIVFYVQRLKEDQNENSEKPDESVQAQQEKPSLKSE